MSYARIIEDGCYIYPKAEEAGIQIELFPEEELNFIPDSILDFILYKMSNQELEERRKHGKETGNLLKMDKYEEASNEQKDFFKWREKNV
nr:MAG TPA: hypothetical protein [Caudoviricetes sp.]